MEAAGNPRSGDPSERPSEPRRLPVPHGGGSEAAVPTAGGSSGPPEDVGRIVDALKSSADQELTIAERLSSKARQAFALAAGVFVVAQTVAFGGFRTDNLGNGEQDWMIGLGIGSVVMLLIAALATIKADATFDSRDLPLTKLENDLNAAYAGDPEVTGRLGGYYLGVVRSRRKANVDRRTWYKRARLMAALSLLATVSELILSLAARAS